MVTIYNYLSSPTRQRPHCRKFEHVKPRCKNAAVCPLCADPHPRSEHQYPNPAAPKGVTANLFSTVALPHRLTAPTTRKIILLVAKTTRPARSTHLMMLLLLSHLYPAHLSGLCHPVTPQYLPMTQTLRLCLLDSLNSLVSLPPPRPQLALPSWAGSTSRIGYPQLEEEPSPSPTPRND